MEKEIDAKKLHQKLEAIIAIQDRAKGLQELAKVLEGLGSRIYQLPIPYSPKLQTMEHLHFAANKLLQAAEGMESSLERNEARGAQKGEGGKTA